MLLLAPAALRAQVSDVSGADDTRLEYILIFGRHGVRSPVLEPQALAKSARDEFPDFAVRPGYLTDHGRAAEKLLGSYFRQYLRQERLLSGGADDAARGVCRGAGAL